MSAPVLPISRYRGVVKLGSVEIECHVLNDGRRFLGTRTATKAITGNDSGGLAEYLSASGLKPFVSGDLTLADFVIPGSPNGRGLQATDFVDICTAYVTANDAGALKTKRQRQIASRCAMLISSLAKLGIVAVIDEATGNQALRPADEMQVLLAAYISEAERAWAKTFPDELWFEFDRMIGRRRNGTKRPQIYGKLVKHQIYGTLDPTVMKWLEQNRPDPRHGKNWHQNLTEFGRKKLEQRVQQILGIAMACYSIREFRERVAEAFTREPVQRRLPLRTRAA